MDVPQRVAIVWDTYAPYRGVLFDALAGMAPFEFTVIYCGLRERRRQWHVQLDGASYQWLAPWAAEWPMSVGGQEKQKLHLNPSLPWILRRQRPEVIITAGFVDPSMYLALLYGRRCGVPVVMWSDSNDRTRRQPSRLRDALKRWYVKRCDGFLAAGAGAARYLTSLGAATDLITHVPNVADNGFFTNRACEVREQEFLREQGLPANYLLYVGQLVPRKNVGGLIEAFAEVAPGFPDWSLVVVGDGPGRQEAEEAAAGAGLAGRVLFCGYKQPEELVAYYTAAQCLVLPSFSEPWGLVVNESLCCGTPVVCSTQAGCTEALVIPGKTGYRFDPYSPGALPEALRSAMGEPKTARVRAQCVGQADECAPEKAAEGYIEAAARALGRRRGVRTAIAR